MKAFFPVAFAVFCIAIAHGAEQSARATMNEYQERQAETVCQVSPAACGLNP